MKSQTVLGLPILLFAIINVFGASKEAVDCGALNCGKNTTCKIVEGNLTCVCKDHHVGNPYIECLLFDNSTSSNYCGLNAVYTILNGVPVCHCTENFTGDPYVNCEPIAKQNKTGHESCNGNNKCKDNETCYGGKCQDMCTLCGRKAECYRMYDGVQCQCPFEYVGDPYKECFYIYDLPSEKQNVNLPKIPRSP